MTSSSSSMILLLLLSLLISLVEGQTAPEPPLEIPKWKLAGPVKSIQGSYRYRPMRMDDHPPTWASIWELSAKDFSIVAWPPKYCAAVHVYFIPNDMKGNGNFHVTGNITLSPSILFYPPTGKVQVQLDTGTKEIGYNQRTNIHLKPTGKDSVFEMTLAPDHQDKVKKYESNDASNTKTIEINLKDRMALVLANSRFCFAHILKDGNNGDYTQLLDVDRFHTTSQLPQYFTTYDRPDGTGVYSLFVPPVLADWDGKVYKSTKSVDLLPVLLNPVFHDQKKMRQKPVCNGFTSGSRNKMKKAIGAISSDSWIVRNRMLNSPSMEDLFHVNVGAECAWIRLWITAEPNTIDTYKTILSLDETIDIFFNQQFFVGPDSDEARPLSGNSTQIDRITFKRHLKKDPATNMRTVQMSYGRGAGPGTFIEYFHMPSYHLDSLSVHLIKAEKCEANIVMTSETLRTASANKARYSALGFTNCRREIWVNENKDLVFDDKEGTAT